MKKFGLALGAGGSRGVAHIGFLKALEEEELRPDLVTGCSMGAIVGACYCAGVPVDKMKERALSLRIKDIASFNVAPIRKKNGFMRMNKVRDILIGLMGEKSFDELEIPFACVATDLVEGKCVVLNRGSVVDAALASSSIPGVFSPYETAGYSMLVDGGLLERVPTKLLKSMGAEKIVAVDVLGDLTRQKEATGNLLNTLLRCIDVMDTQNAHQKKRSRRYVDLWIEPELIGMDQYQVKNLSVAYDEGYKLGKEKIETIKSMLS